MRLQERQRDGHADGARQRLGTWRLLRRPQCSWLRRQAAGRCCGEAARAAPGQPPSCGGVQRPRKRRRDAAARPRALRPGSPRVAAARSGHASGSVCVCERERERERERVTAGWPVTTRLASRASARCRSSSGSSFSSFFPPSWLRLAGFGLPPCVLFPFSFPFFPHQARVSGSGWLGVTLE